MNGGGGEIIKKNPHHSFIDNMDLSFLQLRLFARKAERVSASQYVNTSTNQAAIPKAERNAASSASNPSTPASLPEAPAPKTTTPVLEGIGGNTNQFPQNLSTGNSVAKPQNSNFKLNSGTDIKVNTSNSSSLSSSSSFSTNYTNPTLSGVNNSGFSAASTTGAAPQGQFTNSTLSNVKVDTKGTNLSSSSSGNMSSKAGSTNVNLNANKGGVTNAPKVVDSHTIPGSSGSHVSTPKGSAKAAKLGWVGRNPKLAAAAGLLGIAGLGYGAYKAIND